MLFSAAFTDGTVMGAEEWSRSRKRELGEGNGGNGGKVNTYLRPHEFCQGPDELRSGVYAQVQCFFVDGFADGEPEGGFETLLWGGGD